MRSLVLFSALALICAVSCKKKPTPANGAGTDVPGPVIQLTSYPLTIGNMWVYSNGDTLTAVADTVINGVNSVKIRKSNGGVVGYVYLANMADGIHETATSTANGYIPAILSPYGGDISNSLIVPDTSWLLAKLPAVTKDSWTLPFTNHLTRQWIGYVTVTTKAGTFNCIRLNTELLDEYYSEKGLIKSADHIECLVGPCPPIETTLTYVNF